MHPPASSPPADAGGRACRECAPCAKGDEVRLSSRFARRLRARMALDAHAREPRLVRLEAAQSPPEPIYRAAEWEGRGQDEKFRSGGCGPQTNERQAE